MRQRAAGLFGDIDLTVLQPLDEFVRRDIDNFQVGVIKNGIGNRLPNTNARKAGDDVVETFDMLDIKRRHHVNASVAQFLNILPPFRVPTARCIAVRKFVD